MAGKQRYITALLTLAIAMGAGHIMQSGYLQSSVERVDVSSEYQPLRINNDSALLPRTAR